MEAKGSVQGLVFLRVYNRRSRELRTTSIFRSDGRPVSGAPLCFSDFESMHIFCFTLGCAGLRDTQNVVETSACVSL